MHFKKIQAGSSLLINLAGSEDLVRDPYPKEWALHIKSPGFEWARDGFRDPDVHRGTEGEVALASQI